MTLLEDEVKRIIRQRGPIPFRDFMELALYHPRYGYYTRLSDIGPGGDYYTSANIHPLFGELLAEKFVRLFRTMTEADPPAPHAQADWLTLVEIGAGTGQLAEDILRALRAHHPSLFERMSYWIIEASPRLTSLQQARLRPLGCVAWARWEDFAPGSLTAIVFSHEVLDAFPVHRVVNRGGRLMEMYVALEGDELSGVLGELTDGRLAEYLRQVGVQLDDGQIADIALDIVPWLRSVSRVLARGFLMTIDYGDTAPQLYAPHRREGTLRCFFRHTLVPDPLIRIGDQDITASVDFTLLVEMGRRFGLEPVEFVSLRRCLLDLGLLERVERLMQTGNAPDATLKDRLALKHFLLPGAFGENFKVLVQRKDGGQTCPDSDGDAARF